MENLDKKSCECGTQKMCCGGNSCFGKHHLIKMILKIFIIILIFWCGFTLGKMVGLIKGEYGHGMFKGGFEMKEGCKNLNTVPPVNNPTQAV